jgi:hypothetical protein
MPIDTSLCTKVWSRYAWARDNGHAKFVEKADICERMFAGDQWDPADKAALTLIRRPALTINKILSTLANVMGEQIYNRAETSFRPRNGAPVDTAGVLNKVFKQISDNNQLAWKRSEMFADGAITSRGFLDVRIDYNDQLQGEVRIDNLNPKNVILDPDGEEYDPDTWGEVFITKWVTADDIAILYSPEDAELLRNKDGSFFPFGYDSIEAYRDRFGDRTNPMYTGDYDNSSVQRNIRVIERQYRMLDKQQHFLSTDGDTRPIPAEFDRNRIAWFVDNFGFKVITKLVRRIRWCVIADNVKLHDDWSPYKHFTVVPFFPYFRRGTTIGLVENLVGPQELLNKVTSQELHVLNTTANSGWKIKAGALTNMSIEELEQKGAQTGIVLELSDMDGAEKIQPNTTPQGLDRMSFKAEEHIKGISGVSDSMQGFDREDVAAKAIQEKKRSGSTNLVKPLDNLTRSDFFLARNVIDLVQEFYTEHRVLTITQDELTGATEDVHINQVDAAGKVVNDLMLGEYSAVITSVPFRETLEDSQFDQAIAMREQGIAIPDDVVIESSRLLKKKEIVDKMNAAANSPEAQQQKQLQLEGAAAEVAKVQGEAQVKQADAGLKKAKTTETLVKAHKDAATPIEQEQGDGGAALTKTHADIDLNERKFKHEQQMDHAKLRLEHDKEDAKLRMQAHDQAEKRADQRAQAAQAAAQGKVATTTPGE